MSWYDLGNPPINSTQAQPTGAPSTATLLAEVDSTQLGTALWVTGQHSNARVTWIVGASTTAIFQLEHATSTELAAPVDACYVQTPTGQSAQYVFNVRLQPNSRLRARLNSTAANAVAFIQAEFLS